MGFFSDVGNFFKDPVRVAAAVFSGGTSEVARLPGGEIIYPQGAAANKAAQQAGLSGPKQPGPGQEPKAPPERQSARDPISLIMRFLGRRRTAQRAAGGEFGARPPGVGLFDSEFNTAKKSLIGG